MPHTTNPNAAQDARLCFVRGQDCRPEPVKLCSGACSTQFSTSWHTQIVLRFQQNSQPGLPDKKANIPKMLNLSHKDNSFMRCARHETMLCPANISKICYVCHKPYNVAPNFILPLLNPTEFPTRNSSRYIQHFDKINVGQFSFTWLWETLKYIIQKFFALGYRFIVQVKLREPNPVKNRSV